MSKKHTNTCYDCIHLATCYKIEHFGRDLETNIPCKEFIGVNDRVEVVRCKDCKYAYINSFAKVAGTVSCKFWADKSCGTAYTMQQNDFCSYGERKEFYNGKD